MISIVGLLTFVNTQNYERSHPAMTDGYYNYAKTPAIAALT
jgi:hypothetical protein